MEDSVYQEFLELEADHWWFRGRRTIFIALLDRFLRRGQRDQRLLMDLGCGVGGMLGPMAEYGRVVGTDVTFRGLEHCARRGFERLAACHGPVLPFRDGSFDCVTAFDALEHIDDDVGTMAEIFRTLKPGGYLVASGPAYMFLYAQQDRITHHVRRYTLGEFTGKAESVGFRIEKATYINVLLFPAILPAVLLLKAWQKVRKPTDQGAGSNVGIPIPTWLNDALAAVFSSEAKLFARLSAPCGHSLVMVAQKPA
ncbi:MAG: class I SAM-dependent methyltransferase [Planctomycetes bacterium]|nr:class I SAM-dependent methyltransferase [Planctomycetota bacterium]